MNSQVKRLARKMAGANVSCPVVVVDGAQAPALMGDRWHYRNRSGERIAHPSAYRSRGFSSMIYCASTRRVVVGADWAAEVTC